MSVANDLKRLTKNEKKIYYSILRNFPAISHDAAMDYAILGGTNFQFYPK